jgi:hypothetical protein
MIFKLFFTLLLPAVLVSAQKAAGPSPAEVNGPGTPPKDQGGIFGGNMFGSPDSPKLGGGSAKGGASGSSMTSLLTGGKAGGGILAASKSYT